MRRRARPLADALGIADFRYARIVGALEIQPRTRIVTENIVPNAMPYQPRCRAARTTSLILGAGTLSALANASALMLSGLRSECAIERCGKLVNSETCLQRSSS
jgi:hypothetical protein